ncbi:copper-binding protein [Microvirga massiliensis]|uniref:copper-binding protein n=1 Tax=Microvirga massiliensis TaxID=1033741 RepID=UPI00062B70A4|nr:copper-binding protein [Microvirga massiliensis]
MRSFNLAAASLIFALFFSGQALSQNTPMVSGIVQRVDASAGKITIDHGPIPNLDMDAMTMVFRTPNPAILEGVKAGDRIRFQADRVNGRISVIRIEKSK